MPVSNQTGNITADEIFDKLNEKKIVFGVELCFQIKIFRVDVFFEIWQIEIVKGGENIFDGRRRQENSSGKIRYA